MILRAVFLGDMNRTTDCKIMHNVAIIRISDTLSALNPPHALYGVHKNKNNVNKTTTNWIKLATTLFVRFPIFTSPMHD